MRGLLFRIVIIIQTILLLTALSVPAWAASNEQPAEWVKDTLSPVPMIYPQHNEKYESLVAQAVVKYERAYGDTGEIFVVIPDVKKAEEIKGDTLQTRIFAYVSYGSFSRESDGKYRQGRQLTGPFEILIDQNLKNGETQTFCGTPIPPRKLSPETWEAFELTEDTFDPSMFLKENIQNTASPETANRLSASLDRDKEFTLSVWTDIIGKSVETASQNEISSAMQLQQNKTISPYQAAVNQYQQLSQERHYEP